MSASASKWSDLGVRIASAVAMILIGGVALLAGGGIFWLLITVVIALMMWELARLCDGGKPRAALAVGLSVLPTFLLILLSEAPLPVLGPRPQDMLLIALMLLFLPWLIGIVVLRRRRSIFLRYSATIYLGCFGLFVLRESAPVLALGVIAIVIVTDVAGYFAGRAIGGPKFWPEISPKKTWSGTVAGWIGAALIGGFMAAGLGMPVVLAALTAIMISFASQMGDIAESAIKRRAGVKDASALIPGHGGLLDRFDGLIFAAGVAFVLAILLVL